MNNNVINSSLYQDFVYPNICRALMEQGLKVNTVYKWRILNGQATLTTNAFDKDEYYIQGNKHTDAIEKPGYIQAFQIKDMEKLLPDYMLTRNNTEYELHCSNLFDMEVEKANRLPDVFAITVLKAIESKKINVAHAIKVLNEINR